MAPCDLCLSALLCTSCLDNFTLVQGVCQCQPQYYQFDADTCLACVPGCLECTGPTACTLCDVANFFVLDAGICTCQVGMFLETPNNTCEVCGSMSGCIDCNMDGCIQCDALFGFSLNVTDCICDYGEYITPMDVCAQCRQTGCLDCDS